MLRPKMILIDLDGTLIDSVPDLAYSVDAMMARLGRPPRGEAAVRTWVGNGVERLVQRALTGELDGEPSAADFALAYPIFLEIYGENTSRRSALYPGVREGLDDLRAAGYPLGCVTNKAAQFTLPLLADLGVLDDFGIVVSGDTLPEKKPHPAPLLHAARHFGVAPADALDDRRLGQRCDGGARGGLCHHLHELWLQPWPGHSRGPPGRGDRQLHRTARIGGSSGLNSSRSRLLRVGRASARPGIDVFWKVWSDDKLRPTPFNLIPY